LITAKDAKKRENDPFQSMASRFEAGFPPGFRIRAHLWFNP